MLPGTKDDQGHDTNGDDHAPLFSGDTPQGVYDDEFKRLAEAERFNDLDRQYHDSQFNDIAKHYDDKTAPQKTDGGSPSGGNAAPPAPSNATPGPGQLKLMEKDGDLNFTGAEGDKATPKNRRERIKGRVAAVRSFAGRHRLLMFGLGGLGVTVIPFIMFILTMLGAFAIPHFAENVGAWQFAKVTRANAESTQAIWDEKIAVDSASDSMWSRAKERWGNIQSGLQSIRDNTWGRFDKFRLNKPIQQLEASDGITYNYEKSGFLARDKLTSITFRTNVTDDPDSLFSTTEKTTVRINRPGYFDSARGVMHPVDLGRGYLGVWRATKAALKVQNPNVPTVFLDAQTLNYLRKIGANISGLRAREYLGNDDKQAKVRVQQEIYEKVDDSRGIATIADEGSKKTAEEAKNAEKEAMADPKQVEQTLNGDLPDAPTKIIVGGITESTLKSATTAIVKWINPIYNVAVPLCIVYEGSVVKADQVDMSSQEVQRAATVTLSAADQLKRGYTNESYGVKSEWNAETAGSMTWKLNGDDKSGGIEASNAIMRANGQNVNTLANTVSTQGGGAWYPQ